MKRFLAVLLAPLATRLGTFAGGAVASWGTTDPALLNRVEAWVVAGCLIGVDLLAAGFRNIEKKEGR
ncbi:MAG: hypothetical protein QUV71_07535 [Rhizobium sp.]|nr:hypothetical protein [Rhizobium sp.]MDM8015803.1 hypothetical protein [Rhizobium sp.]